MSNIVTAKIKITGTRPLFLHKFGRDAMPLEKREKTGVAGNDPEEWRKTVDVTKEGQIFMDSSYAFAAIRDGARYTKKGRGSIQPSVSATLQIVDDKILVDRFWPGFPSESSFDIKTANPPCEDPESPVYLDVRGVRNPSTRGRNIRYRVACSRGWSCEFDIEFDKTIVSRSEMESALRDAGRLCGIANGRAIGMGRFTLDKFYIIE